MAHKMPKINTSTNPEPKPGFQIVLLEKTFRKEENTK